MVAGLKKGTRRAVQKALFFQIITSKRLFAAPIAKKSPQEILSQNSSRNRARRASGHAHFWLAYIGEIPINGLFSTMLPFHVLGTMLIQYKW